MSYYKNITCFTNIKRTRLLQRFNKLAITYFSESEFNWYVSSRIENQNARQARQEINIILDQSAKAIRFTGISTIVILTSSMRTARPIDLLEDIFRLYMHRVPANEVYDCIERAIGVYEHDRTASIIRTVNPFFWINKIIMTIVSIPFRVLGNIGFNKGKAEASLSGRIFKGILYIATLAASGLYILDTLGILDRTLALINKVLNL